MITALLMMPLLGVAGMAVDYGHALSLRHDLMGIADAAALGAIAEGADGAKAANGMTKDGEVKIAADDARRIFLSQRATSVLQIADYPLDVEIKVNKVGQQVTSVANFSLRMPTSFMHLFGKHTMTITGSSTAISGSESKSFTDFYMLLDNSPSMGIAATTSGMRRLIELTSGPEWSAGNRECAFACHLGRWKTNGTFDETKNTTYTAARSAGVILRIDVVAQAAKALIDRVKAEMAASANRYSIAAYSFGKSAPSSGYPITKVASLSSNMSTVGNAVGEVGLMTTDHHGYREDALTSFDTVLTSIGKEIDDDGGSGATENEPQKVVYFVTDGLGDSQTSACSGSKMGSKERCLEPIDTAYCDALKQRNIKIAILYTTYNPLTGDHIWETYIKKRFADRIGPKLRDCASTDLFFEVGPDDDMEAAMAKLFVKAASRTTGVRLAF
jgi:Flp pilus assembly protein TadG